MDSSSTSSAQLPPDADLLRELSPHLGSWMHAQRWYAAKAGGAATPVVLGCALVEERAQRRVLALVVRVGGTGRAADYQVPLLVSAGEPEASDPAALIARVSVGGFEAAVEDATRTSVGREALLGLVVASSTVRGPGLELGGAARPARGIGHVLSSRILSGEQSNSSMIFELDGAPPVILKLFRVLQAGENPDVVVQSALDAAGSDQVAPLVGSGAISWGERAGTASEGAAEAADAASGRAGAAPERAGTAPGGAGGPQQGHSLFAQEFFPGVEDAWRVALRDALAGDDFSRGAADLGAATAQVHLDLAERMSTIAADEPERDRMTASMLARLEEARAEVPAVDASADALASVIERARTAQWPPFQRVHGDYHLGQVLSVPDRGWVLLDFEGEPMRPLAERALPDCPVRDVAGMLRSLDYVAGAVRLEHGKDASAWAARAREAFLEGYGERSGIDVHAEDYVRLLAAFEADKAVYEALYEARNRPDWAPIPLAALERITASA